MKQQGQVQVTIQEVNRLHAITQLSEAMVYLAKALSATPQVMVKDCLVYGGEGPGINIDTSPDVMETMIERFGSDDDED